jgi:hypothetical protein
MFNVDDLQVSPEDTKLIHQIAKRAYQELKVDPLSLVIDLRTVHAHGNPLRLQEMLAVEANNPKFVHDIYGIRHYLNRETGELTEYFTPRFSV